MQSYWFSNKSNINIIFNYSVITITNTMSNIYILSNFGKYAISDCPFIGLSVRPSVRLFAYGIFRWLCICWQITWNKWHKIWHDVVIIGRWLLPSVVDTGDICCHYWSCWIDAVVGIRFCVNIKSSLIQMYDSLFRLFCSDQMWSSKYDRIILDTTMMLDEVP